jgi:hypothetical protein
MPPGTLQFKTKKVGAQLVACCLALVVTAVPLVAGISSLSAASHVRHTEIVGPAGPDFAGVGKTLFGWVALGWATPLVITTLAMWLGQRWALPVFARLCMYHLGAYTLIFLVMRAKTPPGQALHAVLILAAAVTAYAAAFQQLPRQSLRSPARNDASGQRQ